MEVTGFWFQDTPASWQPPADLVTFILNYNKYPLAQKDLPAELEALKAIKITAPK